MDRLLKRREDKMVEEGKKAGKKGSGALKDFRRGLLLGVVCQVAAFVLGKIQDKIQDKVRCAGGMEQTESRANAHAGTLQHLL